ncbi:MAG: hypothetical protein QG630_6 [Patescibacteria group bacterium]|nr:hypothetical protein [Patescibacteria group bacterium]
MWFLSTFLNSFPEGKKLWEKYQTYTCWYYKGWLFKIFFYIPIYSVLCDIFKLLKKQNNPLYALDDLYTDVESFGFNDLAKKIYNHKSFAALDAGDD